MRFITFLIIIFFLSACQKDANPTNRIDYTQIKIYDSIQASRKIESIVKPYRNKIKSEMNKALAYSPQSLYKTDGSLNTPISNLMADAVLKMSAPIFKNRQQKEIDAVLLNYGGIRAGINKGKVSVRTAYNIMPFENNVVIAELKASSVHKMIDYLVKAKKAHPIAGLQIRLNENGALQSANIDNQPIHENETYYIATSDYLFNGGDNMKFFKEAVSSYDIDYKLRNLFIDYFLEQDTLQVIQDDRFIQK